MLPFRQVFLISWAVLSASASNSIQATDYLCSSASKDSDSIPAALRSETPLIKFAQVADANSLRRYQVIEYRNGVLLKSLGNQPSLAGLTRKGGNIQNFPNLPPLDMEKIELPPGTIALQEEVLSQQISPGLLDTFPLHPQNQNLDKALLAFGPRTDITSHTINTPDTTTQLRESMKIPATAGAAKTLLDYYSKPELSTCTQSITSDYVVARSALKGTGIKSVQEISRQYLTDKKSLYAQYNDTDFQKIIETYISSLKAMVLNCYIPAENSPFAQKHALLTKMGEIAWGKNAACTGLSVGSPIYVLTARHCFENLSNHSDMWFRPAMSKDRYQICAISQSNALTEDKLNDLSQDQVLVRIAPGLKDPGELNVLLRSALHSMTDQKAGVSNSPTLLTQISYMPLANLLFPKTFPSGFVQGKAELCAAKVKDTGCFSHLCSAESGGSGSALFVNDESKLTLAGTHIGQSENDPAAKVCEEGFGLNVATYINKKLLEPFPKTVRFIESQ